MKARLPLDPQALAKLTTPERGEIYKTLGLDRLQIASAEDAVHHVVAGRYSRRGKPAA